MDNALLAPGTLRNLAGAPHRAGVLFASFFALLTLTSSLARSDDAPSTPASRSPLLAVIYHPYGPALDRSYAEPIPDYREWTDDRMERDVGRLVESGFGLVLVATDLAGLEDEHRRGRFHRFAEITGELGGGKMSLCLLLLKSAVPEDDGTAFSRFARWFCGQGFARLPGYHQVEGRSLLVLAPGVMPPAFQHPSVVVREYGPGADWPQAKAGVVAKGHEGKNLSIAASLTTPRRKKGFRLFARTSLRDEFKALAMEAVNRSPKVVVIDSWNDFASRRFVEPNTVDGSAGLDALRAAVGAEE